MNPASRCLASVNSVGISLLFFRTVPRMVIFLSCSWFASWRLQKSYQQWHFFQNLLVLAWDLRQHVRLGSVLWVDQLPFQYITGDDTRMMSSSHRASKALYHTSLAYLVCTVSVMPGDVVQHKSLDNPCSKTLLSSSIISQILIGNTAFMICPVVYDISP